MAPTLIQELDESQYATPHVVLPAAAAAKVARFCFEDSRFGFVRWKVLPNAIAQRYSETRCEYGPPLPLFAFPSLGTLRYGRSAVDSERN